IPRALDIDAVHAIGGGHEEHYVSFDTGGSINSVVFSDEDILKWDGSNWSLYLATTSLDMDWGPADMDALMVPEPEFAATLCIGFWMLGGVIAHRRRRLDSRSGFASRLAGRSTRLRPLGTIFAIGVALAPLQGTAQEGALEINAACAVMIGCFPGDTPGYPVTISEPGAYRLTSELDLGSANTTGIIVAARYVDLDLGGFTIRGVNASGTGTGIAAGITARATRVHNGFVIGTGLDGIHLGGESVVEDVIVYGVGRDGIDVGDESRVLYSTSASNGDDGIVAGESTAVIGNLVWDNVDNGIVFNPASTLRENVSSNNGNLGIIGLGTSIDIAGIGHNVVTNNGVANFDPSLTALQVFITDPNWCPGTSGC
ncbi:MAG: right-handed parallel beta-helix repeat-containing protein, partial [Rhodothermales bacterium]|nr:right-handed parallel beta-helix repeat-containing protein [Rhodothermales bacterium]